MSATPTDIALFGGSFDPPHIAHVMAVTWTLATQPIDAVWIEPVHHHPLDKRPTAFEHRLAMCRAAFGWLGDQVVIRQDEALLGGDGRTVDLLDDLSARHPAVRWRLIMGTDQLRDRERWKDFERVLRLAPPIVLGRPGHPGAPGFDAQVELPAISSTDIRAALGRGERPVDLLPKAVLDYIFEHRLYGARP